MNLRNLRLGSTPMTIGLIFGVILAVVLVLYSLIAPFVGQTLGSLSLFVDIAIYFVFGLLAGRRASRITAKLSSGVLAGALTGLVSSLISGVYAMILTLVNINYYVQQGQILANKQHPVIHITSGYIIQAELEYLVTPLLFAFLLVLIGGTLGAFLGKRRPLEVPVEETPEEVITTTATPVEEEDESPTPLSNGTGVRRSAASRRSRNARRIRSRD